MKNLSDMCEIIRYTGQAVEISKEEVFRDLCCIQESAAYEIFEQEYEQLLELVVSCCRPAVYLKECRFPKEIGRTSCRERVFILV